MKTDYPEDFDHSIGLWICQEYYDELVKMGSTLTKKEVEKAWKDHCGFTVMPIPVYELRNSKTLRNEFSFLFR